MKNLAVVSLAALLLSATPLAAQTDEQVTIIHAGQLLDRPGSAPRGPSTVIFRGGIIVEILRAISPDPQEQR